MTGISWGRVQLLVKAGQRGQVDDGALAGVLPHVGDQEDPGPVLLLAVELDGVLAHHGIDLVEEAVGRDHRVQRVHDHDPADEVGHEQYGVVDLRGAAVAHLVDQHRQAHLQHHAYHHEQQVVAHGVSNQHRRVLEQVREVVQAVPLGLHKAVQEDVLEERVRRGHRHLVLLERQYDAGHRQIAERQQEQRPGQHHREVRALPLAGIRQRLLFRAFIAHLDIPPFLAPSARPESATPFCVRVAAFLR